MTAAAPDHHDRPSPDTGGPVYLYAVTAARHHEDAAGATGDAGVTDAVGVADAPVRAVTAGEVTALVSSVDPRHLEMVGQRPQEAELAWLEHVARTHNAVVESAFRETTVLPMRIATVHPTEESVREFLRKSSDAILAELARLDGLVEVGVKAYRSTPPAPTEPATAPPAAPTRPESPGRAYLEARRAQRRARADADRDAATLVRAVRDAAVPHAVDQRAHRLQTGELADGPGENIANDAWLVRRDALLALHAAVTACADPAAGRHVEVTGPWAPYSFVRPVAADAG
ncbi:GvpL/GvpF family gas vesicle protein [Streptomyces lonarensis]|uniref:GvpL/GvpF family gas vesicle protein n=3 Tax=Streptomyces lonarensis TaxID=700599 RepID=A0A7X6HZH3_9ACTN|nr:GvpL/GvpF family gas vesicle protein [Streptomyces lonarensis]NJQ06239.1 GvpL/GvpF family gas vesicle protein [Streptomyces lonarensis]